MTSANVIRRGSIVGVLALVAILAVGTASMAAAQNNNGGNPFDTLWAAIKDLQGQDDAQQTRIDELTDRVAFLESRLTGDCNASPAPGVDLHNCKLTDVDFSGADLTDANLSGADLTGADLSGADLTRANLFRADLTNADVSDTDLRRANLTRANLTGADLTNANLFETNLDDTNLTDAALDCINHTICN